MNEMSVFPIDKNGFIDWKSHRYEPQDYEPKPNEIIAPIPDNFWAPRWNGKKWVEGKGHPNVPEMYKLITPETPVESIYCLLDGEKSIETMAAYIMDMDITNRDITQNSRHLCDSHLVPVLIKVVQDLQKRLEFCERCKPGRRPK